jgi:hypothetical protein
MFWVDYNKNICRIWVSHSSDYEECYLLRHNAV